MKQKTNTKYKVWLSCISIECVYVKSILLYVILCHIRMYNFSSSYSFTMHTANKHMCEQNGGMHVWRIIVYVIAVFVIRRRGPSSLMVYWCASQMCTQSHANAHSNKYSTPICYDGPLCALWAITIDVVAWYSCSNECIKRRKLQQKSMNARVCAYYIQWRERLSFDVIPPYQRECRTQMLFNASSLCIRAATHCIYTRVHSYFRIKFIFHLHDDGLTAETDGLWCSAMSCGIWIGVGYIGMRSDAEGAW